MSRDNNEHGAAAAVVDELAGRAALAVYTSFDDMPLHARVLRGVYSAGFERPSPIQQRAIGAVIGGGDVIAQAQSGTGKTGAFAIGLLQRLDIRSRATQALVLSPTRELAEQTADVIGALGTYVQEALDAGAGARHVCALFVGQTDRQRDVSMLREGVLVGVGTPGRVGDLVARGALQASALRTVVLDEADEMLSQGFQDQVHKIFRYMPKDVQIALFSATMPDEVLGLCGKFMRHPTRILVAQDKLKLEGIRQFYVALEECHKLAALMDLYESVSVAQSVVFVNTRRKAEWLAEQLSAQHHTVACLHAQVDARERQRVMNAFKRGHSRVLVTTDLVARGIDVQHVNYVINFDVPLNKENYLHRIGRSGRYGRLGIAINLVAPVEAGLLRELEEHYAVSIAELPEDFACYLDES